MSVDDLIPTETSTVQRDDGGERPSERSASTDSGSVDSQSDNSIRSDHQMDQARTVIRDSDRQMMSVEDQSNQTPAAVAKVLLGGRLNHFRIDKLIGGGGMGAVFRALDEHLDRTVAIKVIPFVGDDPELQRRFRNESQSAAKLDHPRIAKVFDTGSHGRWHYIVFEYIEGTNIRDWVHRNGVLSVDQSVLFTCQIADALGHAAERGITHRDVKPSNVLIADDGQIRLVDMGLARSAHLDLSEDMTASGVTLGTFDYISPEQAHDPRDADLRSDLYSLGCSLYFMLTGVPPYPGGTMLQKLLSHGKSPPPDPRELRPEVSANLVSVINKMLAKKPSQRYQNAGHLIADLQEVARRDGLEKAQSIDPIDFVSSNPLMNWLENHLPWVTAVVLLLGITGWLQLQSAVSREQIVIPSTAGTPTMEDASREPGFNDSIDGTSLGDPDAESKTGVPMTRIPIPDALMNPGSANDQRESPFARSASEPRSNGFEDRGNSIPRSIAETSVQNELAAWQRAILFDPEISPSGDGQSVRPASIRVIGASPATAPRIGPNQELYCSTLIESIEMAAQYDITSIQIISPRIVSGPIRIDADNLRITSLTGSSSIVFDSGDSANVQSHRMCSLGPGVIEFEGLHFVWTVPDAPVSEDPVPKNTVNGGTMFETEAGTELLLSNSTITINNVTIRDRVYAIDVLTDPKRIESRSLREQREKDTFPMVAIDLDNVIVRGQMTLIHMDYAAKLWLRWDNGLLAVSGRLIDTAGARGPIPASAGPMQLLLTRVTAHAASGICRVRLDDSESFPFVINRSSRNSVFVVDRALPHFDVINYPIATDEATKVGGNRPAGATASDPIAAPLRLGGSSNAYAVDKEKSDPLLRLTMSDGKVQTTTMNDWLTQTINWADESPPRWTVDWTSGQLSEAPLNTRRPADYRQNQPLTPGFDEKSLPILPIVSEY